MARTVHLSAAVNGAALNDVLSGQARYGWKLPYPEATVWIARCPRQPSTTWQALYAYLALDLVAPTVRNGHVYQAAGAATSGASEPTWPLGTGATVADGGVTWHEAGADVVYDDPLTLTMGAGTHDVQRFGGLVRRLDFRLWPRRVGVVAYGYMVRAAQYENFENATNEAGGVLLREFAGSSTPTDEAVVKAALTKALVPYTGSDILGTGVTWGTRARPQTYVWRAGSQYNAMQVAVFQTKGESALEYIHRWDEASAVYTAGTASAGFYRTYESPNGVYRKLIGGRPRSAVDLTFTEGTDADIVEGSSSRSYPLANRVLYTGFDPALGTGPVYFDLQSSNPFQPTGEHHTVSQGSPFVEWAAEADGGVGMNAERCTNALMLDLNRETVSLRFTTKRDDPINPGMTTLVQAAGGLPDRLGIGENLWVDEVVTQVTEQAQFSQQLACTGGGLPDGYTPAPAW